MPTLFNDQTRPPRNPDWKEAVAMVKVQMKADHDGSADGVTVHSYAAGETYDLPEPLADSFIKGGYATPVEQSSEGQARESKNAKRARARGRAPKDRDAGAAPQDRSA